MQNLVFLALLSPAAAFVAAPVARSLQAPLIKTQMILPVAPIEVQPFASMLLPSLLVAEEPTPADTKPTPAAASVFPPDAAAPAATAEVPPAPAPAPPPVPAPAPILPANNPYKEEPYFLPYVDSESARDADLIIEDIFEYIPIGVGGTIAFVIGSQVFRRR